MENNTRATIQHPTVWVLVVAATVLSLFVLSHIAWLAMPFILAIVLYYVCSPALDRLKRVGFTHTQAVYTFLVVVTVSILLLLPLGFKMATMATSIPKSTAVIFNQSETLFAGILNKINGLIPTSGVEDDLHETGVPYVSRNKINFETFFQGKFNEWKNEFVATQLPALVLEVLSWLPSLLLVPYITFFFLRDGSGIKKLIMRGVPNAFFEKILLLFHKLDIQVKQYFRGLAMLTILNFATIGFGLWLVGMPFGAFKFPTAMGLGIFCAFLAWIPYVGAGIGCITVILVSTSSAPGNDALLVAAVGFFIVAKMLEDFIYTPMTVGQTLRMHPLLTVLMIFVGGAVGGMMGLLLAMPVLGTVMVFGEIIEEVWIDDRLRARYWYARQLRRAFARKDLDL